MSSDPSDSSGQRPSDSGSHLERAAALVLDHALTHDPTLGDARLVCVDGPAGSGKTTLADRLLAAARRRVPSTALVHMDDLYEGWDGLGPELVARVKDTILLPLAAGETGHHRRWDWYAGRWAEELIVDPAALVVMEGVGSAALAYDDLVTTRVWIDAPRDLRLQRGLDRGDYGDPAHWLRWLDAEAAWLAAERTRERADVLVDGTGACPPRLAG
ncbi:uridine kinase [Nocardioides sp.]|uniref:uridine kinase family protein n=1 Tax=Nocardioides sp. TaxID=35761 RepID=UPI003528594F